MTTIDQQFNLAETTNLGVSLLSKGKVLGLLIAAVRALAAEVDRQREQIEALERAQRETREP